MSRLVAVWSPCSGAGVTSVAAGLACALAQAEGSAVAVDLNWPEPGLALALDLFRDLDPMQTCLSRLLPLLEGQRLTPRHLLEHLLRSPVAPGVRVLPGPCHPLIFPRATRQQVEHLLDTLVRLDEPVVLDLNPTLDFVSTWPALRRADTVVWVTGTGYAARYHTRRTLLQAAALGLAGARVLHLFNQTQPCPPALMAEELGVTPAAVLLHLEPLAGGAAPGRLPWTRTRRGQPYWHQLLRLASRVGGKEEPGVAQR